MWKRDSTMSESSKLSDSSDEGSSSENTGVDHEADSQHDSDSMDQLSRNRRLSVHEQRTIKSRYDHDDYSDLNDKRRSKEYDDPLSDPDGDNHQNYYSNYSQKSQESNDSQHDSDSTDFVRVDQSQKKRKYEFNDKISGLVRTAAVPIDSDNKGRAMMEKMGYKFGQGLGKEAQGRVEPVELSKQRGRRGLGLKLPGLDPANIQWDSSLEKIDTVEEIKWIAGSESNLPPLALDTLRSWLREGEKVLRIDHMTDFCDATLLKNILQSKNVFDQLGADELHRARSRSNPFETLRSGMFLNRAALKMANMDSAFDSMFTSPKDRNGEPVLDKNELLYFADVCAGPGGFSEYVLWRTHWKSKGFGFTLKNDNDFKLHDFYAGPPETFEPYYGEKDDGNVFDPDNIRSLMTFVLDNTDGKGVHFMMADGGFSVEGQENLQEILSKQLYLCQCLVALCIVRSEGHFVCKLFDLFTPFSAGIIYLMYRAFDQICIFKPNTSRPANSERYLVCKHRRSDSDSIRDYMFEINQRLWDMRHEPDSDVTSIVPMSELNAHVDFYDYLVDSNNSLGERQVINLIKIAAFCRDENLRETKQAEIRQECLRLWKIPDKVRAADRSTPDEVANAVLRRDKEASLNARWKKLVPDILKSSFSSMYDWHCFPLGSINLNFYLGLGRKKIYRWNPKNSTWVRENFDKNDLPELSPGTLVYGEMVQELRGEGRLQTKSPGLHVVDCFSIGKENIAHLPYEERLNNMTLYAKALHKSATKTIAPVRIKQPTPLSELNRIIESLTYRASKSSDAQLVLENDDYSFQPKGILFMKTMKPPWTKCMSRATRHFYYFNCETNDSHYAQQKPAGVEASTGDCVQNMVVWEWEEGVGLKLEGKFEGVLHKDDLIKFIKSKTV